MSFVPDDDPKLSSALTPPRAEVRRLADLLATTVPAVVALMQRRRSGNYQTDAYGLDQDMIDLVRPLLLFLYRTWWRVAVDGLEHVPAQGRALLVANHSGVLPWDGAMIAAAVYEDHPQQGGRVVHNLILNWFSDMPFFAPLFVGLGQLSNIPENALRLLEDDHLVCIFPEGARGVSKLFRDRYQLEPFGRGGFVQLALRTGAPLLPVAVVGAEETYPLLANSTTLARLFGTPFFPITPFFPWLGLLGLIPLPSRWSISVCPPIDTAAYGPAAADDPEVVQALSEQVRQTIQATLYARLARRTSVFR
jgi:1-acyl-sn-glycerol-3-phosphate acyltransferase